ncbi:hypothetical protein NM688_g2857 [Phlebia brevispora]|uniref:Uncharacterized protein n=1 Tax=Phlebia brevispora TaxID=194682 RepID=A0ACC1T7L3_9APHY|nr:hypothetical protein NM688_g2857 [Phlebia brevispora]
MRAKSLAKAHQMVVTYQAANALKTGPPRQLWEWAFPANVVGPGYSRLGAFRSAITAAIDKAGLLDYDTRTSFEDVTHVPTGRVHSATLRTMLQMDPNLDPEWQTQVWKRIMENLRLVEEEMKTAKLRKTLSGRLSKQELGAIENEYDEQLRILHQGALQAFEQATQLQRRRQSEGTRASPSPIRETHSSYLRSEATHSEDVHSPQDRPFEQMGRVGDDTEQFNYDDYRSSEAFQSSGNRQSQTDVILRTSDGGKIFAHARSLSRASPVFHSMLQRSRHPHVFVPSTGSEFIAFPVSQTRGTWNRILQLLDHAPQPSFTNLEEVILVLEASTKYKMDAVTSCAVHILQQHFVEPEPMRVWVIACRYGLKDLAHTAARLSLRSHALSSYFEELTLIPAADYYRLLEYRVHCTRAALSVAEPERQNGKLVKRMDWLIHANFVFFEDRPGSHGCTCATAHDVLCVIWSIDRYGHATDVQVKPKIYWKDFMQRVANALRDRPCGATVKDPSLLRPALAVAARCKLCIRENPRDQSVLIGTNWNIFASDQSFWTFWPLCSHPPTEAQSIS